MQNEVKEAGQTTDITRYSYDNNGNTICRILENISPITSEQSASIGASVVGKDTNSEVTLSEYDGFNQLIKTTTGDKTVNYTYNADGLRTNKAVNGIITSYVWDGGQIALELDGSGNLKNKYVRGINLLYAENTAGTKQCYLFNGHGDVVQLTNSTGDVVKNYDYDAFGNEKNLDANDTNVFRYCGEYWDKETGTIYLRARYYDPTIGRFISEDSVWGKDSDPLSLNLYTYCHNDPVNYFDPSGHLEDNDKIAYAAGLIDKATYNELVRLGFQYAGLGNNFLDLVMKNELRRLAVDKRRDTYAPNYVDKYDYTHGGTFDTYFTFEKVWGNPFKPEISKCEMPFGTIGSWGVGVTKEVAELSANKISHILQDKHLWNIVVEKGNWGEVSKVISKVMTEGVENNYKKVYSKTLEVGGKVVEVTYNKLKDGVIKISDAWVRSK